MRARATIALGLILGALPLMGVACAANQGIPEHLAPCQQPGKTSCTGTLMCDYDYARACELCRCESPSIPNDLHHPPLIAGSAAPSR